MAITLDVENFQSIHKTAVTFEGFTVIVGPSDRGKSALLRAAVSALFNRAGDAFVRKGAKTAVVKMGLPGHVVRWEKGKGGVNQYRVDGEDYTKVGKGAPQPLQAMGFRDVVIGAKLKDDGKLEGGETIRPQVAGQFDPVFLLNESGVFLNEVLLGLSRLSTLQRAGRLCAADLRGAKTLLKTRQEDLTKAVAARNRYAPVTALQARVERLAQEQARLDEVHRRAVELRAWAGQRPRLLARLAVQLPPLSYGAAHVAAAERVLVLRKLVAQRAVLVRQAELQLPPLRVYAPVLSKLTSTWTKLRPLVVQRWQRSTDVLQTFDELSQGSFLAEQYRAKLAQLKADTKVCPVCDKPW